MIAGDRALVRAAYHALLEGQIGTISVVGDAASGRQAAAVARETNPDVALLDLGLPDLDDPDAAARIVADPAFAEIAVLVLAKRAHDERVLAAMQAGAVGVLDPSADSEHLVLAVHAVGRGYAVLSAEAVHGLVWGLSRAQLDRLS